jgi:hypothetical protein
VAKTRISISLDQGQAERIREHAVRAGMGISAYLVHAATRQMAETEAVEERFSGVDALIAQAQAEAEVLPDAAAEVSPELTEQERQEVEAALKGTRPRWGPG